MTEITEQLLSLMADVVNVRKWRSEPVPEDTLEKLLQAFRVGPSTGQPWEVLRLESPQAKQAAISVTLEPFLTAGTEGAQRWLAEAPVVLVLCLELRRAQARLGEVGRHIALQDIGSALQNLRLVANAKGLRTGVVREFVPEKMREALGLPWFMEPVALVAVGYSDSYLEYPPRYSIPEFYRVYEPSLGARASRPPVHADETPAFPESAAPAAGPGGPRPIVKRVKDGDAPVPAIYDRHSVRRYTGQPLPPGVLDLLLDAAIRAPSAGNMQPWEFIVLEGDEIRKAVVGTTYVGYFAGPDNQQSWMNGAAAIVAVCVNRRRTVGRYGDRLAHHSIQDVAAAIENLMITATAMGLGTCWIGGFKAEELTEILGVPEGVQLISMVTIGYPDGVAVPKARLPLELLTHRNRWGEQYYLPGAEAPKG